MTNIEDPAGRERQRRRRLVLGHEKVALVPPTPSGLLGREVG
ncbi:hypothetical protein ACIBSW_29970 [Actinoplanes sp. NPDC049668]